MGQLPKTNTEIKDLSVEIQMKNYWQNATLQCLILCNYFKVSEVWALIFLSNVCSMNLSGMLRVNIIMQNLTPTLSGTSGAQVFVSVPLFLCLMFIYTLSPKYFPP